MKIVSSMLATASLILPLAAEAMNNPPPDRNKGKQPSSSHGRDKGKGTYQLRQADQGKEGAAKGSLHSIRPHLYHSSSQTKSTLSPSRSFQQPASDSPPIDKATWVQGAPMDKDKKEHYRSLRRAMKGANDPTQVPGHPRGMKALTMNYHDSIDDVLGTKSWADRNLPLFKGKLDPTKFPASPPGDTSPFGRYQSSQSTIEEDQRKDHIPLRYFKEIKLSKQNSKKIKSEQSQTFTSGTTRTTSMKDESTSVAGPVNDLPVNELDLNVPADPEDF